MSLAIGSEMSSARRWAIVVTALFLVALLSANLAPIRTLLITANLVPQLFVGGAGSSRVDEPTRETVTYGSPADRMDVYVPAGARPGSGLPAVVLALGVHPLPIDDPTIVKLASAMARAGVVVGVPDSSALRELRVTPAEPGHLADAALALADRPEVDGSRVGLAGFSAGASMALDAAADPRLQGHLQWVSSFGGYADADRLLVDVASRTTLNADGTVSPWLPDARIRGDILELVIQALPDDGQRDPLRRVLQPIVADDGPHYGPPANTFTGDAARVIELFTARDRGGAEKAVKGLSPELRAQLAGISPTTYADNIHVPVYLLHGVTDNAIPVAHAELLRQALGDRVARLTEFGRFGHGQPGAGGLSIDDANDVFALFLYLRDVVAAATE